MGRDVHDVKYCRADPGYTLMEMLANIGDLLHENLQHAMYAVEPCDLSHKQTLCSVMFSLATARSSACRPRYYQPQASRARCVLCLRPVDANNS